MKNTGIRIMTAVLSVLMILTGYTVTMAHPNVDVKGSLGSAASGTIPYSPKQTCGGCHFNCTTGAYSSDKATWCQAGAQKNCTSAGNCPDYESYETTDVSKVQGYSNSSGKVEFQNYTVTSPAHGASTGLHSQHGRNEGLTTTQRSIWGAPAFISSPGMFGRYCMPSNRQLAAKDIADTSSAREVEMSPANWGKSCGVCHAGGGSLEYDRDMKTYGQPGSGNEGDRYTWLITHIASDVANGGETVNGVFYSAGSVVKGQLVDLSQNADLQRNQLYGDNKAEVDCLMCHMSQTRPGAAYYKNTLAFSDKPSNTPTDDPRFTFNSGDIYDSYNRNIAVSFGYFKQAASAGIGAGINLQTGDISGVPSTIPGTNIAGVPNSGNCAQCHARNEADNLGLPNEDQQHGGMIAGYGNFIRITNANTAFDWDKIAADGSCSGDCLNSKKWYEFGCKTGMGKRSQKTGFGSADRYANGFCLVCDTQNQWANPMSFCGLPSIQKSCIDSTQIPTLVSDNDPMTIFNASDYPGAPMKVPGKMPDVDVHDIGAHNGGPGSIKCASCHYTMSGTVPARIISGNGNVYTYPSTTIEKMDHQVAKGYSMLEKGGDGYEGTVSCPSCHTTRTHPNLTDNGGTLVSPTPTHAGFPALHLEKIDCRTCHIPAVYAMPGRLLFRDWTAGAYRQTEGSNGNANHFEFAWSLLEGSMSPLRTLPMWISSPEGMKITPMQTNFLPIWAGSAIDNASGKVLGWSPAKTRDITAAAARVAAANPGLGIRINGTNDHPGFQGFNLADPLKIESKEKIDLMAAELGTSGGGVAAHATVRDPRINLYPLFYDTSHGVLAKEWALGSPSRGGCVMCHSTSGVDMMSGQPLDPATYSPKSVGFFDGNKEMLQNGFMQMAGYDCDNSYVFSMMTGGQSKTCDKIVGPPYGSGSCDGTQPGTNPDTGTANGTLGLCKQMIGGKLAQSMGMPADPMMRMDGVEFMQAMAIREGSVAAGCNPMMQFFGLPTGCNGSEYFSRDEIRQHFAKSMQQSFFTPVVAGSTWTDPVSGATTTVPSTLGRVFGISAQIGKNPSNANHVNKFDFGTTCRNPMTGQTFPCDDSMPGMTNLINTAVNANQVLGYSAVQYAKLTNPATAGVGIPVANFSWKSDSSNTLMIAFDASSSSNADTYEWNYGDGSTGTGVTASHDYTAAGTYTAALTVRNSANGISSSTTMSFTLVKINHAPVANSTVTVSDWTATVTDASTDPDGDTVSVIINWGDTTSSTGSAGTAYPHTYTVAGTYTIRHMVNDGSVTVYSADVKQVMPVSTYLIGGRVTTSGGSGIASVTINLMKPGTTTTVKRVYTNATGYYTFTGVNPGSYDVVPSKSGAAFTPVKTAVTVNATNGNATNVNFTSP